MISEKENSSPKNDMHIKKDKGGSAVLEIAAALIVAVIIIIWIQNLRVAREVEKSNKAMDEAIESRQKTLQVAPSAP